LTGQPSQYDGDTATRDILAYTAGPSSIGAVSNAVDSCGPVTVDVVDVTDLTTASITSTDDSWVPHDMVAMPDGRFLASAGFSCDSNGRPVPNGRAYIVDVGAGVFQRAADPPVDTTGFRYGGLWADDAVVHLDQNGRLSAYDPISDTWAVGDSVLDHTPGSDLIEETPIVWFDQHVVIVSPGYGTRFDDGGSTCCEPTREAWVSPHPVATDTSTPPPSASTTVVVAPVTSIAATASVPSSSIDVVSTIPASTITVVIANANGIGGTGASLSYALESGAGFAMGDPIDASEEVGVLETTVIYYDESQARSYNVASAVDAALGGGTTLLPLPAGAPPVASHDINGAGVLVMLGLDKAGMSRADLTVSVETTPAPPTTGPTQPADA
jgi:hypothetical protein